MRVIQYVPGYVSGFKQNETTVTGTPELLALEWVKNKASQPGFHRFSVAPKYSYDTRWTLMVEYRGGAEWWVAGFVDERPNLPECDYGAGAKLKAETT